MATNLVVRMEDEPGALARLGRALGEAGVNLAGACATTTGGQGTVHLLVEGDAGPARDALAGAGIDVTGEREVLVVPANDEPGALGALAERLAGAGVNIDLVYVATNTRIVFGVDDMDAARGVVG